MGGRDRDLWSSRPRPRGGESLASWFARVAAANSLSTRELLAVVLPGVHPSLRDLDRFACDTVIGNLARHTGTTRARIADMHFGRWRGRMFERDDGRGVLPWFIPALRDQSRRVGMQYCPHCLAEDRGGGDRELDGGGPFLRLDWRLVFFAVCPRHRTLLARNCLGCGAAVTIDGSDEGVGLGRCAACGARLDRPHDRAEHDLAEEAEWLPMALAAQGGLLDAAEGGTVAMGEYGPVATGDFFYVALRVFQLLASSPGALPLRAHVARAMGWDLPPVSIPRLRQLHLFNARGRAVLTAMTWWLLRDWPGRFAAACDEAGVTARLLCKRRSPAPAAFADPVERLIARPAAKGGAARVIAPYARGVPWGHHRYWKIEGVSAATRTAARVAARLGREKVGAWVDQALREKLERDALL